MLLGGAESSPFRLDHPTLLVEESALEAALGHLFGRGAGEELAGIYGLGLLRSPELPDPVAQIPKVR
jgi:hypothetical protein